ncbi:MAG: hypothetical protein HQK66_07515 [Desulfamplus sp.]|nr:hypothetical protein [Desulfamplus sp.]
MLDIIEVAMEKGRNEGEETGYKNGEETGYKKGSKDGKLTGFQELLMGLLMAKFSPIPRDIAVQIRKIQEADVLQSLIHAIMKCEDINDFETVLNRV